MPDKEGSPKQAPKNLNAHKSQGMGKNKQADKSPKVQYFKSVFGSYSELENDSEDQPNGSDQDQELIAQIADEHQKNSFVRYQICVFEIWN